MFVVVVDFVFGDVIILGSKLLQLALFWRAPLPPILPFYLMFCGSSRCTSLPSNDMATQSLLQRLAIYNPLCFASCLNITDYTRNCFLASAVCQYDGGRRDFTQNHQPLLHHCRSPLILIHQVASIRDAFYPKSISSVHLFQFFHMAVCSNASASTYIVPVVELLQKLGVTGCSSRLPVLAASNASKTPCASSVIE